MEKVFHFDSPVEVYRADACIISCFDARFDQAMRKFFKRSSIALYDHVKFPGSAKPWSEPAPNPGGDFLLQAVRVSMRLHAPPRVLILAHNDCGAYPGVAPDIVAADAVRSAAYLRRAEPSLQVESYFVDFDGIYRLD